MVDFTVVVPLYNKQDFVESALQSICDQTVSNIEILVVNDCSTDNGIDKVRKLKDPRIRIIDHDRNKGLSAARNTGIKNANSDNLAFLDADDLWKPDFLEKISELMKLFSEAGLFATAYEEVHAEQIAVKTKNNVLLQSEEMAILDDFFYAAAKQPILWYGSTVVKRDVFEKVGHFDENITWFEDVDFNIRAALEFKVAYYNKTCALYTIESQNQITRTKIENRIVCDLSKYDKFATSNKSLKLFLDVNRYALAMDYKLAGSEQKSKMITSQIDIRNLTKLQIFLLKSNANIVRFLRKLKISILRRGFRLTTFSR